MEKGAWRIRRKNCYSQKINKVTKSTDVLCVHVGIEPTYFPKVKNADGTNAKGAETGTTKRNRMDVFIRWNG